MPNQKPEDLEVDRKTLADFFEFMLELRTPPVEIEQGGVFNLQDYLRALELGRKQFEGIKPPQEV
jgi:hypothetical protein